MKKEEMPNTNQGSVVEKTAVEIPPNVAAGAVKVAEATAGGAVSVVQKGVSVGMSNV